MNDDRKSASLSLTDELERRTRKPSPLAISAVCDPIFWKRTWYSFGSSLHELQHE